MVSRRSLCLSLVIKSRLIVPLKPLMSRFWGDMIHRAGAGPSPIPQKELTADKLSDAFKYAVSEDASKAAQKMGEQIRSENGEEKGVSSFHRHLPLMNMRSVICSSSFSMAEQADVMLIQSESPSGSRRSTTSSYLELLSEFLRLKGN